MEKAPAAGPPLAVSKALILTPKGGRNPTVATDRRSGTVYLAWAQEVPGPAAKQGKKADPVLQVLVARSDDEGLHFEPPVVVNSPKDHVISYTVSPTQVAIFAHLTNATYATSGAVTSSAPIASVTVPGILTVVVLPASGFGCAAQR